MDLIFLHGGAAAGQLTTARALEELVGFPVFHNHLVVDMLTTVFPFGSASFVRLRERFWLDVFAEAAALERSLTFTFCARAHGYDRVPGTSPKRSSTTLAGRSGSCA